MRRMRKKEAVSATATAAQDDSESTDEEAPPSPPASAYKIALVVRIAAVTVVFLFNVIWLVRARVQNGTTGGVGTAHRGTCDAVENLGTRLHVVINVLLVVVLASTTTFMGLACGPTRTEIDAAHRKRQSLGVGSLGLGNLSWISKSRATIYMTLLLSLIPINLL